MRTANIELCRRLVKHGVNGDTIKILCDALEDSEAERDALAARVKELEAYAKQADEALDEANKRSLARWTRIAKLEAALLFYSNDGDAAYSSIARAALEAK